ncbi:conserved hypothetical protein [Neospora caninum Liverpool]|nr:conserved hypothetical protein [Neospora caninum Liverpool]CBZ55194.1 conserved hypothetical protein [Neospora caninum Liverpool]|eukprot:XP_003885222.1 conserved hypothetical protein [Neospora caninum Liverpool]
MLANFLLPFAGPESERLVHIFAEEMQRPSVPAVSRLAIFYLFHHLLHQPVAAPSPLPPPALEHGNAARLPPQGSRRFGDIGFYAFLVPFMKTLPQFPPLLTEKVLRCCCIFAERGFYTHEAVRHLFAFVPPGGLALPSPLHEIHPLLSSLLHPSRCTRGTSATLSLHAEPSRSAVAACRALSLPALKCLLRMPSVTKGIAHARSKLQELPFNSSLSSSDVSSLLPLPSSAPSSSFSLSPPPPLLSAALFAGMPVNQLTECSAALDRATRLTGQEYILLQSSLLDLSSLLQCMHEDFVGLRASISSLTSSLTEEVSPSKRRRQSQAVGPRERATEERENDEKSKQAKHGEGKPTKGAERRDRGSGNDKSHRS